MRSDFDPVHLASATPPVSVGGQAYSKRMGVIQRTPGPLTRFQQNKMEKDVGIRSQVIDRLQGVLSRADMLDSMLTAGQLDIAVDPSRPYQLVTRVLGRIIPQGYTPSADEIMKGSKGRMSLDKAQLAADFIALKEDIQNMRGPMGAAGFRSLEAFMALQAQRGSLLGDVNVTKAVLRNSMRVFLALHGVDVSSLAQNAGKPNPANGSIQDRYLDAYQDPVKATRAMKLDGYVGIVP